MQLGCRQINLGPDRKQAWQQYHELMAQQAPGDEQPVSVAELFEPYLQWCQQRRAEGTYQKNRRDLRSLLDAIGLRFPLASLRPFHLSDWLLGHPTWSATTQNDAISCIQHVFNWGVKQGRLDHNPIARFDEKPRRKRREVVDSPEEWSEVLAAVSDQNVCDLLMFLRETGCRPQEARRLESRHVDLRNGIVVFPPSESKGHEHERPAGSVRARQVLRPGSLR